MEGIYTTDARTPVPFPRRGQETVPVRMNTPVMLWRVANELYDDAASGLRELVANALTAVEEAISRGLVRRGQGLVSIRYTAAQQVIIEDNGTGITMEVLREVLGVMGNSTNFDPSRAGQYGMGFYAFTKISSTCIIESVTGDGTSFTAVCREGKEFEVFDTCKKTGRGTRITLSPYNGGTNEDGEKIPTVSFADDLYHTAESIALASRIPMVIETEASPGVDASRTEYGHDGILKLARDRADEPGKFDHFIHKDVEMVCMFGGGMPGGRTYLNGMPIHSPHHRDGFIVNLLDERRFKPQPNRERLTQKSADEAADAVKEAIEARYADVLSITTHAGFEACEKKEAFLWIVANADHLNSNEDSRYSFLFKPLFRTAKDGKEITRHATIYWILREENPVYFAPGLLRHRALLKDAGIAFTEVTLGSVVEGNADESEQARALLLSWGLPTSTEVLKRHGLRASRARGSSTRSQKCHGTKRMPVMELAECARTHEVVMISQTGIRSVANMIRQYSRCPVYVTAYNPKVDASLVTPIDEWRERTLARPVLTNRGTMTVSEILKNNELIVLEDESVDGFEAFDGHPKLVVSGQVTAAEMVLTGPPAHNTAITEMTAAKALSEWFGFMGMSMESAAAGIRCSQNLNKMEKEIVMRFATRGSPEQIEELARQLEGLDGRSIGGEEERYVMYVDRLYDLMNGGDRKAGIWISGAVSNASHQTALKHGGWKDLIGRYLATRVFAGTKSFRWIEPHEWDFEVSMTEQSFDFASPVSLGPVSIRMTVDSFRHADGCYTFRGTVRPDTTAYYCA